MSKATHTPGPWVRAEKGHGNYFHVGQVVDSDHMTIAVAHGKNAETEANARLIAAAPELLEALEGIRWKSDDKDSMEFAARITYVQMDAIRATIAKARGEA